MSIKIAHTMNDLINAQRVSRRRKFTAAPALTFDSRLGNRPRRPSRTILSRQKPVDFNLDSGRKLLSTWSVRATAKLRTLYRVATGAARRVHSPIIPGVAQFRTIMIKAVRSPVAVTVMLISIGFASLTGLTVLGVYALYSRALIATLVLPDDSRHIADARSYVGLKPTAKIGSVPFLDFSDTFRFDTYTVRSGDTVSSIAANRSISIDSIISLNRIKNVRQLQKGDVIRIPNMDGVAYTVRNGDNLSRLAQTWGIPVEAILDANDLESETILPGAVLFLPGARMNGAELRMALGDLFSYPVRGRLSSPYGWRNDPISGVRRFHAAIDLAANTGTPVRAAMAGKVVAVGYNAIYGKYIILSHQGAYQTWYAHLNTYRTSVGKTVALGERIGDVGNTGYSTGSHLHFAVFRNGRAIDPLPLLNGR